MCSSILKFFKYFKNFIVKEFSKGHFIAVGNMLMPREMSPKHLKSMTGYNKNVLIDNF